jgi:hypothetical protein
MNEPAPADGLSVEHIAAISISELSDMGAAGIGGAQANLSEHSPRI